MSNDSGSLPIGRRDFILMTGGLLAAAGLGGLSGCGSVRPLRIAANVWPGFEFMFMARSQGWLKPEQVELVESPSFTESMKQLAEGRVDGAAVTLDEVLAGVSKGLQLVVVLLYDVSVGADALLAKPAIKTLAALKGARIGVETSALGTLMLTKALEAAGLRESEVEIVSMTAENHIKAWEQGSVDAVITYEPAVTFIERAGGVRLFDSLMIPDTIFDVLVMRADRLPAQAGNVRHLARAHFKAMNAWKTNQLDTAYRLAGRLQVTGDRVPALFRGLELPDLEYNRHMLGGEDARLLQNAREVAVVANVAPSAVTASLFDASYLD